MDQSTRGDDRNRDPHSFVCLWFLIASLEVLLVGRGRNGGYFELFQRSRRNCMMEISWLSI